MNFHLTKFTAKFFIDTENLLLNEGFEFGAELLNDSTEGILIDPASSPVQSPLQGWSVIGGIQTLNTFLSPKAMLQLSFSLGFQLE